MKTPPAVLEPTSQIAMFGRLIEAENGSLKTALARYVLTLGFTKTDERRMSELASRNQEDNLTAAEQVELRNYIRSGHLLALLHSKARKSLKRRRAS